MACVCACGDRGKRRQPGREGSFGGEVILHEDSLSVCVVGGVVIRFCWMSAAALDAGRGRRGGGWRPWPPSRTSWYLSATFWRAELVASSRRPHMRAPLLSGSFFVPSRQLMPRTISQPLPTATLARSTVSAAASPAAAGSLLWPAAVVCDRGGGIARSAKIGSSGGGCGAVSRLHTCRAGYKPTSCLHTFSPLI
jgi:hypothetical protein